MTKAFYCVRFCRGIDEDDLNLVTIATASVDQDVDFEIIALACEGCDGLPALYHAHFTAPIACPSQVVIAAAEHQLAPNAVLELCEIALGHTRSNSLGAAL